MLTLVDENYELVAVKTSVN